MTKRIIITIIVLAVVIGGMFTYKILSWMMMGKAMAAKGAPAVFVATTKAKQTDWTPYISSIGSMDAFNGVDISPQVSGIVSKVYFHSGQLIKAGEPIIDLDTDVLEAQLKNNQAAMALAKITYERNATLLKQNAISQSQVDTSDAQYEQAKAEVQQTQAQIDQKHIRAPFSGKLGINQINLGQYLQPGTVVTNLQTIDPIQVNFHIPSQNIPQLYVGQKVEVYSDAHPNKVFPGKVTALDAEVNQQTRSIEVQATLPNQKGLLYPGMFVDVHTLLPKQDKVVVVPQVAISYTLYGDSVFVIQHEKGKDGKAMDIAKQVYVTAGQRKGDLVAVLKGLQAGDEVVTAGQLKLRSGMPVKINNTVKMQK